MLGYAGLLCSTAETHTHWKATQLPFGKVRLDEVSVYRSCLQATILAISPK